MPDNECSEKAGNDSAIAAQSTSVMLPGDENSVHSLTLLTLLSSNICGDSMTIVETRTDQIAGKCVCTYTNMLTNLGCILANSLSKIILFAQHFT